MSSEEHEQFRRAILKQRAIDETRRLGLPILRTGMSHNAVAVELRRAVRRLEVRERTLKAWGDAAFQILRSHGDQESIEQEHTKSAKKCDE